MEMNSITSNALSGNMNASTVKTGNTTTGQSSDKLANDRIDMIATPSELLQKHKYDLTISEEVVLKAIDKANKALAGVGKRFEYGVHKKTGEIMVKVINQETNEVIRELPPEKILDLVAKLQEIVGVIIDEKR